MIHLNFRAKVLVPVIVVMVLIVAASMSLPNRRIKEQIRYGAAEQLLKAEAVLKITRQTRNDELLLRYRNVVNEPRIKAWATSATFSANGVGSNSVEQNTLLNFLHYLVQEGLCDVVVLTPGAGQSLTVGRDPQFDTSAFERDCSNSIAAAFQNQSAVETIPAGDHLYDIITVPIFVGDADTIVGAFTFGVENSVAREFLKLTQSELVLFSSGHMAAATVRHPPRSLPEQFLKMTVGGQNKDGGEQIILGGEHFLCRAGWLDTPDNPKRLGYLILSSYERPLQALRSAGQMILAVSALSILSGAMVIWFLVTRATRPLRELRNSAEAVGRGDFSRRVPIRSRDECGELAGAFNRMTENVQQSRARLEQTVTTLKNTQAQLIQSEKLSAVGEFVAGVAHELNNPLTVVMGFSEMLREANVEAKYRSQLDLIFKAAQRCQKIVQSLLSFARRHQVERKLICVNGLIEVVLEIVAYQLRTSNVEVVLKLNPHLPAVMVDEHQIQQVLLNLINNARQAIEAHQSAGKIIISTAVSGSQVQIAVQDNGPGIKPENLHRIFDPFFTTKEVGKGTGLGLSLCYGIVKEHEGDIKVTTNSGLGTTFTVELPATSEMNGVLKNPAHLENNGLNPNEGRGKKILVIDDEEAVLEVISASLSRSGYQVESVTDGKTGLYRLKHHHYDLTLCDWKMPGLSGREVYENLLAHKPELCQRIIFITGDVINEPMREFLEHEGRPCLSKPFALADLCAAVKSTTETHSL